VPTEILLSLAERRGRETKDTADLFAIVFLVPMIARSLSCALSLECRAFECAFLQMGIE
jgi:hypothetical protein